MLHICGRGEVHKGILAVICGEKRSLERPRHRGKNTYKMNFQETGWEGVDWIDLAQDRDKWK
jgi:hypothetical protein